MAEVFTKYTIDTSQAVTALEGMKREVRELQGTEGSSQKTFDTNAQKRGAAYAEEEAALKELQRQREILLQKGTISAKEFQQLQKYNTEIEQSTSRLKKMGDQVVKVDDKQKNLNKSSGTFLQQLTKIGATLGIAFGVREILRFTKEAANLAAEAEGVRTAFERVGGTASMLKGLQEATRGTVDQLELMRQTVRASNFKVPLEQLATFFEFATIRAIETGESVDYLVNSIIDGIGRKSTLVMDNLGISATELQEEIRKVGDFGEAAANIIERELGKAGNVADTSLTKIQRSQAALNDATIKFGDIVAPVYAGFLDLLSKALIGVNALVTGMSRVDEEDYAAAQERLTFELEGLRKAAIGAADAQDFYRDRLEKVRQELIARGKVDATHEDALRAILAVTIENRMETEKRLKTDKVAAMNATQYTRAMVEQIPVLKQLIEQIKAGNLTQEESVGIGRTIADIQEDIKNAQERLNKEVGVGTAEYYQARAALDALNKELEQWTKNTEKQITLLEELELDKIGGVDEIADQLDMVQDIISTMSTEEAAEHIKGLIAEFENVEGMERFVEGLEKMFLNLNDAPAALEGLEAFTALIDGMDSEADKIMALRSAIAGLGEDSPALKAALEGQLEALLTSTDQQKEELLDSFVRTEEEIATQSLDIAMQLAENLLKIGAITQEQYEAIIDGVKEKMDEIGSATEGTFASTLGGLAQLSGAFKDVFNTMAKDAEKNAQFLNALTLFTILLNQAEALSKAIASAKGVTAVDYIVQIGIAVAAVVGAIAKAKAIQNQAKVPTAPRFAYGGEVEGRPHTQGGVHIEAERGEYIVKSSAYAKAKEAVHAINSERFDTYVTKHYIEPLLKSKQLAREDHDRGFARNIAESLHLDGKAEHYLKQIARRGNGARIENWDELARLIKKDGRGSTY